MVFRNRTNLACCILAISVLLISAPSAGAQGLFGVGLPGMPSLGGYLGGPAGCGEKVFPKGALEAYVGYMESGRGMSISYETRGLQTPGGFDSGLHRFSSRGVWFGLADSVWLTENLGFLASGWILLPSTTQSREQYNRANSERTWDADPKWWFVDGLFAAQVPGGFSLLAGLRYDYFSIKFKNPFNSSAFFVNPNATADAIAENWIPLVGTQFSMGGSYGNVLVRVVGFPVLLGNVKYKLYVGNAAPTFAEDVRGNWNNGYFLEVFAEYSKKFGAGSVGIFARWNGTEGKSTADLTEGTTAQAFLGDRSFDLNVTRTMWTVGGSFGLDFNLPMLGY
ncbi:MAG TPA: hypothetical protein VK463_16425 [Desulfomonilaceae bacterium]|nr:hypothetical protein [Desulfomonilaceae bacterium]